MDDDLAKPKISTARNIARKLLADAEIIKPPILIRDVVKVLKKSRDLSVYPWSFGDKTSGVQITLGNDVAIGYNNAQHVHRQRFTVAHEIGHLLMGHTSGNKYFDLKSKNPQEIEANQFAAELLMPLKMIKKDLGNDKKVKDLSDIYNVSEEAVWWRISDCKLINKL